MIYLGADHRGFNLKEKMKEWFSSGGFLFKDLGNTKLDPNDDYPIFAERVAEKIANEPDSLGILMCGSGVGVDIVANKFDGVRASIGKSAEQVVAGRMDDNMNVLVLAADFTNEKEAKEMTRAFLETKFSGGARFERRLAEIQKIERKN